MKTPATLSQDSASRWVTPRSGPAAAPGFGQALSQAQPSALPPAHSRETVVREGDNLTRMVKAQAQAQGQRLDESTAYRLALQVARHNGIANADAIAPGQRVDLSVVDQHLQQQAARPAPAPGGTQAWLQLKAGAPWRSEASTPWLTLAPQQAPSGAASTPAGGGEILARTLQRAVAQGFLPAGEEAAVRQRIEGLAQQFGFSADDFALLSLMESDGLNPQASNGSCHGVIQFCEGPNRGAASVGMADQPRAILGMGVLQQLDLVERYLSDAGVPPGAGLDDLYLSVLTPAARAERDPDAALPIAGRQASALYVNGDASGVITRRSLVEGLMRHAAARLGLSAEALFAMREGAPDAQVASAR
jgi:hypothetical protein